ncbi:MAG: DNA polymerase I [Anaerolineales bacterium]
MPPTLYLLDGHALAYRAYFALTVASRQPWQTSRGEPTAAVYGFSSILLRILEQEKPEYLAIAFDAGRTFRDEIFPAYKATRAKMPDEMRIQMERIRQIVEAFGIPRLEIEGYEADDILGSAARQAVEEGYGVKIITGDRDLLQLVGPRVAVVLPGKSLAESVAFLTAEEVMAFMGVRPEQIVDFKALAGDKSDNIPGVPGIGEKTAQQLLQKYASLDNIYAHLEEIEPRWRAKLESGREQAYLSRELARIRTDLPLPFEIEKARSGKMDRQRVEALFTELEFRSLLRRLGGSGAKGQGEIAAAQLPLFSTPAPAAAPQPRPASGLQVFLIDSLSKLERLLSVLEKAETIAFDTETTSQDEMQAELVGLALAVQPGEGYYLPFGHQEGANLPLEALGRLRPFLTDPRKAKVGHHLKYDYIVLARHGLAVTPLTFDTMIAEWLCNPDSSNLGLKNLVQARLGEKMTRIEELIGSGKGQRSMAEIAPQMVAEYAVADAETTLRLMPILRKELEERKARRLLEEVEMPLVTVLAEMEMHGVLVDTAFLKEYGKALRARMGEIEEAVYRLIGKRFNLNSTQQLSEALFDHLGLVPPDRGRRTQSGHYSTSAEVLEQMRGQHEVIEYILEHRELAKLKSTYVDGLLEAVDLHGRVHTSYSQTAVVTGRLSSSNPNLQNIPIRTESGRQIRRAFIAAPGYVLLSADYSQIELRIMAHLSGDDNMIAAFRAGQDIHRATAAAIYGVPMDAVTPEMRRHAKAVNFGLIYGMTPYGLTRTTDLTLAEAEAFVEAYFRQFPRVREYINGIRHLARRQGYVETLLGRRRYFPMLVGQPMNAKLREEREAINAPIQGTAADIMKLAMIRISQRLREAGLHGQMLLQVHDEVVIECPENELRETARLVRQEMENAYPLRVPLVSEARWGKNWGEMEALDEKDTSVG